MQEMPLLVFTLAEQISIGALITLVALQLMGKVTNHATLFKGSLVVAVIAILGMCASLAHLGQPMRCVNAIMNFGTSWLSREIVFFGGFVGATVVYAVLAKMDKMSVAKVIGIIAAICGVAAIVSTCLCYMMPGVPAWNTAATPLQFILVAAVCGGAFGLALTSTFDKAPKPMLWWGVFVVALIAAVIVRYLFFADIVLLIDLV